MNEFDIWAILVLLMIFVPIIQWIYEHIRVWLEFLNRYGHKD